MNKDMNLKNILEEERATLKDNIGAAIYPSEVHDQEVNAVMACVDVHDSKIISTICELIDGISPNQDKKGLSMFTDPENPFTYKKGTPKGDYERKMFCIGYLQAKKDFTKSIHNSNI